MKKVQKKLNKKATFYKYVVKIQQIDMFDFKKYYNIKEDIKKTGNKTKIIAISKNHPFNVVEEAISKGVTIFGENRVQEAKLKFETILKFNKNIELHLTGPLQTNKVKQALDLFDVFHTLDREKLLNEFAKHPEKLEKKSFFIQVNTGKEETKSGVIPEQTKSFFELCKSKGIKNILGLMCIPPIKEDPKKHFEFLKDLSQDLKLSGLSIGMSSDYVEALKFDPEYIRLGTVLFGERS